MTAAPAPADGNVVMGTDEPESLDVLATCAPTADNDDADDKDEDKDKDDVSGCVALAPVGVDPFGCAVLLLTKNLLARRGLGFGLGSTMGRCTISPLLDLVSTRDRPPEKGGAESERDGGGPLGVMVGGGSAIAGPAFPCDDGGSDGMARTVRLTETYL